MSRDTLTGSRIRERRVLRGVRQADLARQAGISASYLNLIEHNRRRIGGKLLLDIATILEVEPTVLTEGAEATLIATLREAASALPAGADAGGAPPRRAGGAPALLAELDRVEEFAGRFPGWAALIGEQRARIAALERTVETLTDRMTHDPHLAASLHEMLTTVTAVHSAAGILAEPGEIDPEWQARFHRNIHEDSGRLAETARGLVTYLEADSEAATELGVPQEELESVFEQQGHHVPELEQGAPPETASARLCAGMSGTARVMMQGWLQGYAEDAARVPAEALQAAIAQHGVDPLALSQALGCGPARVMRRLATLPPEALPEQVGLAICDGSGVLSYRKALADFPMPRFGAGCPLWPLYRALNRPNTLLRQHVAQPGMVGEGHLAYAIASAAGPLRVNADPLYQAHMLVVPVALVSGAGTGAPLDVGTSCRVCPRTRCEGRREPSVLTSA
jgi:predicted transcriptional regulator/DNA-binding XRE family transcriptional regulator